LGRADGDAILRAPLRRVGLELLGAARDDDEVDAVFGKLFGDGLADTARSAGYERSLRG